MDGRQNSPPLTAEQVHLAGELLMPKFREAVRAEVQPLADRIAKLEGFHNRVSALWSTGSSILTFAATLFWGWATRKHD